MKLKSLLIAVIATLLFETEHSNACDIERVIRLVNGRNKFEGRVEVCQDGQWRTVCDRGWGNEEAKVVCRQLGFSGDLDPIPEKSINVFDRGSGEIIKASWSCTGTETNLLDCPRDSRECNHDRDAGVYCFGETPNNCVEGNIRLENGNGSSGRVEVCLDGYWGTVCDDGWDSNDANTVCRQLEYGEIGVPTRGAYFGEGSGPIHLSGARCSSQDTKLTDCTIDKTGINNCNHSEDAGVICMACEGEGDVRLVNGQNKFEGRVEVCQGGQWRTVCDDRWGNREARVVCRQLGFSGNLDPIPETSTDAFGQGSGEIINMQWECVGTETNLLDCPRDSRECNHDRDAGVYCFGEIPDNCVEGNIRLEDGDGSSARGRVEVCLDGLWGTVCDDGWDSNDATTVCRQLGYNETEIGIPTRGAYFGEGSGPIHLSRAQCSNHDTRLINCIADRTGINNCDHNEDAGVICMGPNTCRDGDVWLVGGESERLEGQVEICYSGVWGTVCADNGWEEVDANVVCRQLGYGQPAIISNTFGVGQGLTLLFNVNCNHTHSELSQCVHSESIGLGECNSQDKRAGVICPELASFSTAIISQSVISTMNMIELSTTTALPSHSNIITSVPHPQTTVTAFSRSMKSTATVFNNRSTDVYSTITLVFTTQRVPSTDVFSNVEETLRIILPVVGGALALAIITVTCICFIGVMIARKKQSKTELGGSVDNPTYEEGFDLTLLAREVNCERDHQNPIYNDVGARPTTINANTDQVYEGLYSETTLFNEAVYESPNDNAPQDYLVPETILNKQRKDHGRVHHNGTGEGTTLETKDDDYMYSALGPTDYFTLQPHIPKPIQQQHPPADDEYSQLHHL